MSFILWVKGEEKSRRVSSHKLPRIGEKVILPTEAGDSKNWEHGDQLYIVMDVVHPLQVDSLDWSKGTHIPNVWVRPFTHAICRCTALHMTGGGDCAVHGKVA